MIINYKFINNILVDGYSYSYIDFNSAGKLKYSIINDPLNWMASYDRRSEGLK